MKLTGNIDVFELLGSADREAYEAVRQERKPVSSVIVRFSNWFKQVVLLSGVHYTQIDHQQELVRSSVLRGWRFGALSSCLLTGVCLCINIIFIIYVTRNYPPEADGIGVFATKTCKEVLSATTKIHLGINVLATILVAASNYNMQCMTAPSRRDINFAHEQGRWLDIGIQSVRNLRYVPRWKAALWLALLISTLPLHLLWNSAVFSITTSNRYGVLVVSSELLKTKSTNTGLDCTDIDKYQEGDPESYATCWLLNAIRSGSGLEKLSPEQCVERYATRLESDSSNIVAVARNNSDAQSSTFPPANASLPVLAYFDSVSYSPTLHASCVHSCSDWCTPWKEGIPWDCTSYCNSNVDTDNKPYNASTVTDACLRYAIGNTSTSWRPDNLAGNSDWICEPDHVYESSCSVAAAKRNVTEWRILPELYEIDHCLSSRGELTCKLLYSSVILYVAIICNVVKFLAIALHLIGSREPILATVGDALASFLDSHDPNTKGKCLYTTNTSYSDQYGSQLHWEGLNEGQQPLKWERGSHYIERWHQGASWAQVFLCMLLWLLCLFVSIYYLIRGIAQTGVRNMLSGGFGTMNLGALVSTSSYEGGSVASILTTSLLVNLPQVLFSSLYFMYNSIYTCMASAYEWSLHARVRKGIRVTDRTGYQRSSYWLQLPWKFSLPLLIASAILHWLISQSAFLVNLSIYTPARKSMTAADEYIQAVNSSGTLTAIGYSPLAMMCGVCVVVVMLIALVTVMQLPLKSGMPLVGSNSFAISAACHPPENDRDVARKKIMWGAAWHQQDDMPGHCCFTSLEVGPPRMGEFYAGDQTSNPRTKDSPFHFRTNAKEQGNTKP